MTTPYGVTGCRCAVDSDGGEERWVNNPHCPYHGILPRERTDTGVYRVVTPPTDYEVAHGIDGAAEGCTCAFGEKRSCLRHGYDGDIYDEVHPGGKYTPPRDLHDRLRQGIEQAERGETVDRGDFSQHLEAGHDCFHPGCTYPEPHRHGFACDNTCASCGGHYDDTELDCCGRPDGCIAAGLVTDAVLDPPGSLEWFAEERRRRDAARDEAAERVARLSQGLNERLAAVDTADCGCQLEAPDENAPGGLASRRGQTASVTGPPRSTDTEDAGSRAGYHEPYTEPMRLPVEHHTTEEESDGVPGILATILRWIRRR